MKIVIVVDKMNTAIYRQAVAMENMADYISDLKIISVHPKKPSMAELEAFRKLAMNADLIDFRYWKSADMLLRSFPFVKDKKKILSHYNPYNLREMKWWDYYDENVVANKTQAKIMKEEFSKEPVLIPLSIDLRFFKFQREYPKDDVFKAIMVANRIESKKGILEVAQACRETKTRLILVGRISDMEYYRQIVQVAGDYIDFRQGISEEQLRDAYYEANIFINNSIDNFESGTLPHLEAMACGVPVLTREVGTVPDINNGKNMLIMEGEKEDIEKIKKGIIYMKENRQMREKLREEGFSSIVARDNRYNAKRYYRLYRKILYGDIPLVSIIIPTYNRKDALVGVLSSCALQTYKNIEAVVIDDGSDDSTGEMINEFKNDSNLSLKYIKLEKNGYGLARARNIGVLEANGEILVFCDDRLMMEANAVEKFVNRLKPRVWLYGNKGAGKRSFVENFSCIYKADLVRIGMFNERVNVYGGMTRDLVNKMNYGGVKGIYEQDILCKVLVGSKSRYSKKDSIIEAKYILWKLWG